jgi:hypothetical protein
MTPCALTYPVRPHRYNQHFHKEVLLAQLRLVHSRTENLPTKGRSLKCGASRSASPRSPPRDALATKLTRLRALTPAAAEVIEQLVDDYIADALGIEPH